MVHFRSADSSSRENVIITAPVSISNPSNVGHYSSRLLRQTYQPSNKIFIPSETSKEHSMLDDYIKQKFCH